MTTNNNESPNITQYLTFVMRDEEYGVKIIHVREVLDLPEITKLPNMPDYMCGVINLREQVVPIVDMGQMLGMPALTDNSQATIVIFKTSNANRAFIFGAVVDKVKTVIDLASEDIEPLPPMRADMMPDFVDGMGLLDGDFLIIIDIEAVMATNDLGSLSKDLLSSMKTMATDKDLSGEEEQIATAGN